MYQIFVKLPQSILDAANIASKVLTIDYTTECFTVNQLCKLLNDRIYVLNSVKYNVCTEGYVFLSDKSVLNNQTSYTLCIKIF
jgi:hypothetical protein